MGGSHFCPSLLSHGGGERAETERRSPPKRLTLAAVLFSVNAQEDIMHNR